jgi:hypothetical protein
MEQLVLDPNAGKQLFLSQIEINSGVEKMSYI